MRRIPARGEEGIGVHGENRRPPASGAGGSVEAPTVPGARGQSLERRPPPPRRLPPPRRPHPPHTRLAAHPCLAVDRVGRAGKRHTHRDGAVSFLITVHYSPGSYRRSGHKGQWTEGEGAHSEQQQGARVTGRSGKMGHSGRGSCRARGAWAGGGAARLDELRSSVRGPRKAARRFGTRTPEARRGAGRTGRAAGDAYLAQQCPRYRNP